MKSIPQDKPNGKTISKSRYFCFLLYPDSSPQDALDRLTALGQPIAISPAHDKDVAEVNKETGEVRYKKKHVHCIYVANNNVTTDSVRKKLQRALGTQAVNMVQICDNVGNYYKYLTHESADAIAKGKPKYDASKIILLNNFDIDRYTDLSKEAKEDMLEKVCDLIENNYLCNIVQLKRFVREVDCGVTTRNVMDVAQSYSSVLRMFFDGAYQESKNNPRGE